MPDKKKPQYIVVKHGRVTLLCKPQIGADHSFRSIGTFTDEKELERLIEAVKE